MESLRETETVKKLKLKKGPRKLRRMRGRKGVGTSVGTRKKQGLDRKALVLSTHGTSHARTELGSLYFATAEASLYIDNGCVFMLRLEQERQSTCGRKTPGRRRGVGFEETRLCRSAASMKARTSASGRAEPSGNGEFVPKPIPHGNFPGAQISHRNPSLHARLLLVPEPK